MTSSKCITSPKIRRAARRLTRELLICLVLPAALMLSVEVMAQQTEQSQPQTQQRSDEQIANDISARLKASSLLNPLNLSVYVHGGIITLAGTVPSPEVRQQAVAFMQAVPGVKSVDDHLTIGAVSAQANEQMSAPANENGDDRQADSQAPENQGPQTQGPGNQNPQDQGPGPAPPPPSNPYGPPPETAQNGPEPPQAGYANPNGNHDQSMVTIPAGTPITAMMLNGVNSKHTKPGAHFRAVLVRDVVLLSGAVALPRGAYVDGTVIDSRPPGHLRGHPKLALQLTGTLVGDAHYPLSSYLWARRGPGKGDQTTGNVVGGAAGGAIIGGAVGGGPTALLGAALGGLGGAGLSALSGGARLVVPPESVLTFYLNAPLTVREPTADEMRSLSGNVPAGGYGPRYGPGYGPGPYGRGGYPPPPPGPPGGYPY